MQTQILTQINQQFISQSISEINIPINLNQRCELLIRKIRDILIKYASWNEPKSLELHRWSDDILNIKNGNNLKTIIHQKIDKLRKSILENPYERGIPLQKPMLICQKGSLMEEWQLQEYLYLGFNICPFHTEPLEKIKSHEFAKELLDWSSEVENLINDNEGQSEVSISTSVSSSLNPFSPLNSTLESSHISYSEMETKISAIDSNRGQLIPIISNLTQQPNLQEIIIASEFYISEAQRYMTSCYLAGLKEGLQKTQRSICEVKKKMEEIVELKVEEFQKQQEISEQENNSRLKVIERNYNCGLETIRSYVRDLTYRLELERRNNQILIETALQEQIRQRNVISSLANTYNEANAQIHSLQSDLKKAARKAKQNQCIIS